MDGITLDQFNKSKPSTIHMAQFHSHLSDEIDQDASTTATHICIIIFLLLSKGFINSFLTSMWDHMDSCANQYNFSYGIYLLSCLDF